MGNILQNKLTQDREVNLERIYCAITVGTSGAVTSFDANGVKSVVKESAAGQYTITLADAAFYSKLQHANIMELHATAEDITFQVISENVDDATTPVVVIQAKAVATAANSASGSKILVELVLQRAE